MEEDDWKEELREADVDVDAAIARFSDKEERYIRYLKLFQADTNYEQLIEALQSDDCKRAFEYCHTLKGLAGNLGLRGIFQNIYDACELLRSGVTTGALDLITEIGPQYETLIAIIKKNLT